MNPFERKKSTIIHKGKIINLRNDELYKDGSFLSSTDVIEHGGSIIAVPYEIINEVVYFYMVKQWRNPVEKYLLEFPAGTIEKNENPEQTLIREMQEEIGMIPQKIEYSTELLVAPGWCTQKLYYYIVSDLKKSKLKADIDEEIKIEKLSFSEVKSKIRSNEITDIKSITSFYLFCENNEQNN